MERHHPGDVRAGLPWDALFAQGRWGSTGGRAEQHSLCSPHHPSCSTQCKDLTSPSSPGDLQMLIQAWIWAWAANNTLWDILRWGRRCHKTFLAVNGCKISVALLVKSISMLEEGTNSTQQSNQSASGERTPEFRLCSSTDPEHAVSIPLPIRHLWLWDRDVGADPSLVPDSVNHLYLEGYMAQSIFYVPWVRFQSLACKHLSASRCNLERHPYTRGDRVMQPAALQQNPMDPGLPAIYGVGWLT